MKYVHVGDLRCSAYAVYGGYGVSGSRGLGMAVLALGLRVQC